MPEFDFQVYRRSGFVSGAENLRVVMDKSLADYQAFEVRTLDNGEPVLKIRAFESWAFWLRVMRVGTT